VTGDGCKGNQIKQKNFELKIFKQSEKSYSIN